MIYTVGRTEEYEHYLATGQRIMKAKEGSVWQTYVSARMYLRNTKQDDEFSVYGVAAHWEDCHRLQSKKITHRGLRFPALIIRVPEEIIDEAEELIRCQDALYRFMELSPWITRVEYDDQDKPYKITICRFCTHLRPDHYTLKDRSGPACPLIVAQEATYFNGRRLFPEKEHKDRAPGNPGKVDQEAS